MMHVATVLAASLSSLVLCTLAFTHSDFRTYDIYTRNAVSEPEASDHDDFDIAELLLRRLTQPEASDSNNHEKDIMKSIDGWWMGKKIQNWDEERLANGATKEAVNQFGKDTKDLSKNWIMKREKVKKERAKEENE